MGLRNQSRWQAEEIIPYGGASPQTAALIAQQGEEQARRVAESEESQERARQAQFQMREQVGQTKQRASESLAQGIVGGVTQGVEQYGKAKDRAERKQLTEEQLAASRQQREIAAQNEQRAAERAPVEMEGLRANTDVAKAQASKIAKDEEFENAEVQADDALPGESNRAYRARKEIETTGYNAQTARQQLAVQEAQLRNEEQRLAQAKDMAPVEKAQAYAAIEASRANIQVSKRNIEELDRQKSIKDATSILQAEMSGVGGDPQAKQQRIQAAVAHLKAQNVPAAHIAEAINNANASEAQKAFMARQIDMMDPEKQFTVQTLLKGKQDYTTFKQATNAMQNAYERYKNSSWAPDTEGKAAVEQFAAALEAAGENELAQDIRSNIDPGRILQGKNPLGREERMKEVISMMQTKWGQSLKSLERDDPRFGKMGEEIANMKYQPIRGPNIASDLVRGLFPTANAGMSTPGQNMSVQTPPSVQQLGNIPGLRVNQKVGSK